MTGATSAHSLALTMRVVALAALAGCSQVEQSEMPTIVTGGEPTVKSFVLSTTYFVADPGGAQSCPQMSQSSLDIFERSRPGGPLKGLSGEDRLRKLSEERARQLGFKFERLDRDAAGGPPSAEDIERKREQLGVPPGKGGLTFLGKVFSYDSCTDPQDFVAALSGGLHLYRGPLATGLNLDGRVDANDFSAADGERGIDNELWRAIGCVRIFRETGDPAAANKTISSARAPTLIEVADVNDAANDPEVTVTVYTSKDPLVMNAEGGVLAHASFDADLNPALRSTVRGRIVDGLLTTDPFDFEVIYKEQIVEARRRLRGARIQARIQPNGSIEGGMYGYYDVENFLDSVRQMSQLGADLSGFSCPDVWQAVTQLADGFPDPKTGRYTAISSALHFVGVPAYVIDEPVSAPVATLSANSSNKP